MDGRQEEKLSNLEIRIEKIDSKTDIIFNILQDIRIEVATNKVKLYIFTGAVAIIISGLVSAGIKVLSH